MRSFAEDGQVRKRRWWRLLKSSIIAYAAIGLALAAGLNFRGFLSGAPTALSLGESLPGSMLIWFWWFCVPALTWPVLGYWMLYHWLSR
jgi:hypothetical protein